MCAHCIGNKLLLETSNLAQHPVRAESLLHSAIYGQKKLITNVCFRNVQPCDKGSCFKRSNPPGVSVLNLIAANQ